MKKLGVVCLSLFVFLTIFLHCFVANIEVVSADVNARKSGIYFVDATSICVDNEHYVYVADDLKNGNSLIYIFYGQTDSNITPLSYQGKIDRIRYHNDSLFVLSNGIISRLITIKQGTDVRIDSSFDLTIENVVNFDISQNYMVAVIEGSGNLHDKLYVKSTNQTDNEWVLVDSLGDMLIDVLVINDRIYTLYDNNRLEVFKFSQTTNSWSSFISSTVIEIENPNGLKNINNKPLICGTSAVFWINESASAITFTQTKVSYTEQEKNYNFVDISSFDEFSVYVINSAYADKKARVENFLVYEGEMQFIKEYAGSYFVNADSLPIDLNDSAEDFVFAKVKSYPSNILYSLSKNVVNEDWLSGKNLQFDMISHIPQLIDQSQVFLILNYSHTLDDFFLIFFDGKFGWIERDLNSLVIIDQPRITQEKYSAHYSLTIYNYPYVENQNYMSNSLDTSNQVVFFTSLCSFSGFGSSSGWDYVSYSYPNGEIDYGFIISGELETVIENPPTYVLAQADPYFGQQLIVYSGSGENIGTNEVVRVNSGSTLRVFEVYENVSYVGVYVDNVMHYGYVYNTRISYTGVTLYDKVIAAFSIFCLIVICICLVVIVKKVNQNKQKRLSSAEDTIFKKEHLPKISRQQNLRNSVIQLTNYPKQNSIPKLPQGHVISYKKNK